MWFGCTLCACGCKLPALVNFELCGYLQPSRLSEHCSSQLRAVATFTALKINEIKKTKRPKNQKAHQRVSVIAFPSKDPKVRERQLTDPPKTKPTRKRTKKNKIISCRATTYGGTLWVVRPSSLQLFPQKLGWTYASREQGGFPCPSGTCQVPPQSR